MKPSQCFKILSVALIVSTSVRAEDPPVDGEKQIGRALEIQGQANLDAIKSAINSFRQGKARYPRDLQELVSSHFINALPAAPAGQRFVYDAQMGSVILVGTPATPKLPAPTPANAMAMALDVQAKANLKKITTALNVYMTEHEGQFPDQLEELVKSGMLDKLPPPPSGMKYFYDPKSGKVDYVGK